MNSVGRREFLKVSGATVGAFVIGACGGGSPGSNSAGNPSAPSGPTGPTGPTTPSDLGVYSNYHAGDDFTVALGASTRRNSIAWQRDQNGLWASVAKNVWRDNHYPLGARYTGRQFIAEPIAVNIAPNGCGFGTNGTAGWSVASSDGATLSVVDDATMIKAAGLQLLAGDTTCLKLDNSAGPAAAVASVPLGTLQPTQYSFFAYVRGGTGSIFINQAGAIGQVAFAPSGSYVVAVSRNATAAATPATFCIRADAGQVVQFLLPQVEASPSETSPIPNATTGSITRQGDNFSWAFTQPPGPMAIYMRSTWMPFYRFNPYLGIGAPDVGDGQFIHLGLVGGIHTRLLNNNISSVSGDTVDPNIGDDCMVVGRFDSLGNGQCEQSLNGQASTFSAAATDNPGYDTAFLVPMAAIGRFTGVAVPIVGSHLVMASNTSASLAVLEAL